MKHLSDHIRQLSRRYFPLHWSLGPARASFRQGLASTGWESRKPIQEALMKTLTEDLIVAVVLVCLSLQTGCRTLSTAAGSPPSGPVNGMLYYLPIGKITIKGEFKSVSATDLPDQATQSGPSAAGSPATTPPGAGSPPDAEGSSP